MKRSLVLCALLLTALLGSAALSPDAAAEPICGAYCLNDLQCHQSCVRNGYSGGHCNLNLCHRQCVCYVISSN